MAFNTGFSVYGGAPGVGLVGPMSIATPFALSIPRPPPPPLMLVQNSYGPAQPMLASSMLAPVMPSLAMPTQSMLPMPGLQMPGQQMPGLPMLAPPMPGPPMSAPPMFGQPMPPPAGPVVPLASLQPYTTQPSAYGAQPTPYGTGPTLYPPAAGGMPGAMAGQFQAPGLAPAGMVGPNTAGNLDIWNWFQAVDTDRNGRIDARKLQKALQNGNCTPFNAETCRLMIGMFDVTRNGTIGFQEFGSLWKFIHEWKACFDRFDTSKSGNIDANELHNAFRTFGFTLSVNFTQLCVRVFDKRSKRCINFDNFIQVCIMVKTLSDRFREKDVRQGGVVTVHYEEFLRMALDSTAIV